MGYVIRRLNFEDPGEVNTAASMSMLTLLETLEQARRDPTIVPNFSIDAMAQMYMRGRHDDDHRYWVALDEGSGRVVGHAIALLRYDDSGAPYGYSYTRYVLPRHRRRGLARALLSRAMTWWRARDARYVEAHTHPDNRPLLALFGAEGFEVVDEREDGRWPAVTLRLDLGAVS